MIAKIICRLFGHKKPSLFTPNGMRCICSRCGYARDTLKAFMEYEKSGVLDRRLRETIKPLTPFRQFQELKERIAHNG